MEYEWIGVCEHCGYRAHVSASSEADAIVNSIAVHKQAKAHKCKGLFVAALRENEVFKAKAVA